MSAFGLEWSDWALVAAGLVVVSTATIHGTLLEPIIVKPILRDGALGMRRSAKALIRPLLHVSTLDWFVGGIALIATAWWVHGSGRLVVAGLVGTQLSYAMAANAWGTRGRHPGWMLMAVALILIAASFLL